MPGTFVADIRLSDSEEVIQLPVVWQQAIVSLCANGHRMGSTLSSNTRLLTTSYTLEEFLAYAGRFFGKDPTVWVQMGEPKVEQYEEAGKLVTKSTGVFSGTELHLLLERPLYDMRLPVRDDAPDLRFNIKTREILHDEDWQMIVGDQPWTLNKRRIMLSKLLQAKLMADDVTLHQEGAHGMWELSMQKAHHADIQRAPLVALLAHMDSKSVQVTRLVVAAVWAMAVSSDMRRKLADLGVIQSILQAAKRTLTLCRPGGGAAARGDGGEVVDAAELEAARDQLQAYLLGGLQVLLVDSCCRAPMLAAEPNLQTLFTMCNDLEGYTDSWTCQRRGYAAEVLYALCQRDAAARSSVVSTGALHNVLALLHPKGPGYQHVQFCMSSLLATLVLDEASMALIEARGECVTLLDNCLSMLAATMQSILDWPTPIMPEEVDSARPTVPTKASDKFDPILAVKLAETCAEGVWGSARSCAINNPHQITEQHIERLGKLGLVVAARTDVPLGGVGHCVAASFAALASQPVTAEKIMDCPSHTPLKALAALLRVRETQCLKNTGHILAGTCSALAFLAVHPMGAVGDECMRGPYRQGLLGAGVFRGLLECALDHIQNTDVTSQVIQQAAAVGLMFLTTMAGEVEAVSLAMYSTMMVASSNVQMVEYLMAGMWILLRQPGNRKVLGQSLRSMGGDGNDKLLDTLDDAIVVHDVTQQAEQGLTPGKQPPASPKDPTGAILQAASASPSPKPLPPALTAERSQFGGSTPRTHSPRVSSASSSVTSCASCAHTLRKMGVQDQDDWGLDALVRVGNSWMTRLMDMDAAGEVDLALLKLFEFLTASMCLYMIEDDSTIHPQQPELYMLDAPEGARRKTWWTVAAAEKPPEPHLPGNVEGALAILLALLNVRAAEAWKSVQLSAVTLWNAAARDPALDHYIARAGAAVPLLNIINSRSWPPSTRDVSAGLLQNMIESDHNLEYVGGMVPFVSAMVELIQSRRPLLELRGAWGLGRITCHAPSGSQRPSAMLVDCKTHAAQLGAIEALVDLLRRNNRRYLSLLAGGPPPSPKRPAHGEPDTPDMYERNVRNMEGVKETYLRLLGALLNLSVLPANQPLIAKAGLLTLLETNSMLYQTIMPYTTTAAIGTDPQASDPDAQLVHLCSSIIQNLSLHPSNRTRLYKAELRGGALMEKIAMALEFGPQSSQYQSTQPVMQALQLQPQQQQQLSRSWSAGDCQQQGPQGAVAAGGRGEAALRPKALFPPIKASGGVSAFTTDSRPGTQSMGTASPPQSPGYRHDASTRGVSNVGGATGASAFSMEEMMATMDSREQFLSWLDHTFLDCIGAEGGTAAMVTADGRAVSPTKRSCRKVMWDEEGNWLEDLDEMEPRLGLNKLLSRPLSHLWHETPEARSRMGRQRWEPPVSEYREPKKPGLLTSAAGQLLTTSAPVAGNQLNQHAAALTTSGRLDGTIELPASAALKRPPTRERKKGRQALTVLMPDPSSPGLTPPPEPSSSPDMYAPEETPADAAAESGGSKAAATLTKSLKVVLAPQRPRTIIGFEDRMGESSPLKPTLTIFEHVNGSRVYRGLFPDYTLPNGKKAFMYYQSGLLVDETHVDRPLPPPRPTSVPQALQQGMPLAGVLDKVATPPGTAAPFVPYKPIPRLVPLPDKHTLDVKRPKVLQMDAFGELQEHNLQLTIQAKKIIKTHTETRTEDILAPVQEEREPWTLPQSIFKNRAKESDSRNFWDQEAVLEKAFERDWQRACSKEKFTSMMARENKNKAGKDDKTMLQETHDLLKQHYQQILACFVYYASMGSGDPYHLPLNSYTTFLDDCGIPDNDSANVKRSDCDTIFIVCNFQPDKKSAEALVNDEHAMMRYEFLECIVRLGIAKYGKGQTTNSVTEAVQILLEDHLLANLPPTAQMDANGFRNDRLYNEEVDNVLKRHAVLLKALYSRYRLKPAGGGLRSKAVRIEGWMQMLSDACMMDSTFTLQDGALCFLWARMTTVDEIKDYNRYSSLTFTDFLEALARVADLKSLPPAADLAAAGYSDILAWALDKERQEGNPMDQSSTVSVPTIFRPRQSVGITSFKTRPLHGKLELFLDLLLRRLHYDPADNGVSFSHDAVLKLLKKIDKDLGP